MVVPEAAPPPPHLRPGLPGLRRRPRPSPERRSPCRPLLRCLGALRSLRWSPEGRPRRLRWGPWEGRRPLRPASEPLRRRLRPLGFRLPAPLRGKRGRVTLVARPREGLLPGPLVALRLRWAPRPAVVRRPHLGSDPACPRRRPPLQGRAARRRRRLPVSRAWGRRRRFPVVRLRPRRRECGRRRSTTFLRCRVAPGRRLLRLPARWAGSGARRRRNSAHRLRRLLRWEWAHRRPRRPVVRRPRLPLEGEVPRRCKRLPRCRRLLRLRLPVRPGGRRPLGPCPAACRSSPRFTAGNASW